MAKRSSKSSSQGESFGEEPGQERTNQGFAQALAWAVGGAIIFTIPILMTMEMWWLGFYISPFRLALLTIVTIPLLTGLSFFAGFEETSSLADDVLDALVAYAVGFVTAALVLPLFGEIGPGMAAQEIIGKLALQAIPGSIGALLARDQLGGEEPGERRKKRRSSHGGKLFIMTAGAMFLSFHVAPAEEIRILAHQMTGWHALLLLAFTLLIMHGFLSSKKERKLEGESITVPWWSLLLRLTVVGYGIALVMGVYILWTFGRLDGLSLEEIIKALIVLGFPAGVGAAAAQLIL